MRLAFGGNWGSMRQSEINAAACGSNGASRAPPSPPLAKKSRHISKLLKKIIRKKAYQEGKCCRVELYFKKSEIYKLQPGKGAQRRITSPHNVLGALGFRRQLGFDAAIRNERGSLRKQRRIESAAATAVQQGAATHLQTKKKHLKKDSSRGTNTAELSSVFKKK